MSTEGLSSTLWVTKWRFQFALLSIPFGGLAMLFLAGHLTGNRAPTALVALGIAAPILAFFLESFAGVSSKVTTLFIILPAYEICLAASALMLGWANSQKVEWDQLMILLSITGMMLAAALDTTTRLGVKPSASELSPLAIHVCLLAIAMHLMRRQNQLLGQTIELTRLKDRELRAQAIALADEFQKNEALARKNACFEEHERFTALLHSGVATNLSAIAVLQNDQNLDPTIGLSARHGLFELRLMTNAAIDKIAVLPTIHSYFSTVIGASQSIAPTSEIKDASDENIEISLNQVLELIRIIHETAVTLRIMNNAPIERFVLLQQPDGVILNMFFPETSADLRATSHALTTPRIHAQSVGAGYEITPSHNSLRISLKLSALTGD